MCQLHMWLLSALKCSCKECLPELSCNVGCSHQQIAQCLSHMHVSQFKLIKLTRVCLALASSTSMARIQYAKSCLLISEYLDVLHLLLCTHRLLRTLIIPLPEPAGAALRVVAAPVVCMLSRPQLLLQVLRGPALAQRRLHSMHEAELCIPHSLCIRRLLCACSFCCRCCGALILPSAARSRHLCHSCIHTFLICACAAMTWKVMTHMAHRAMYRVLSCSYAELAEPAHLEYCFLPAHAAGHARCCLCIEAPECDNDERDMTIA
jgi:hypothetical protein